MPGTETTAALVITNDRWNAAMARVAVLPVRSEILPAEERYAVAYGKGFVTAARVLSVFAPPHPLSPLGPVIAGLETDALAAIEDRLCEFLELPGLQASPPSFRRPAGDTSAYPLWGEIYRGPVLGNERKRFVVVSPSDWNRTAGMATGVRTTTQLKIDDIWFPPILDATTRAACGDTTTFAINEWRLARRDRPAPFTTTSRDMVAIGRGLADTYELGDALERVRRRV
jgi:mRNA-degrading endonuclease toxin of MazEF toxin-antitoxin module